MSMLGADEADLLVELAASPDDQLDASAIVSRILGRCADRLAGDLEYQARRTGNVRDVLSEVKFLRQWSIDLREPVSDPQELAPLADWIANSAAGQREAG